MCNWVTRVTLKHRLIILLVPTVICLGLSIAATSVCKFTQLKFENEFVSTIKVKYGLFRAYDPFEDECKSVYDNDIEDKILTSQYKAAQALAIITILVLTSSIICVSILLFRPFSPCIMKLNKFLLVIGLAANITVGVLMILKSTVKLFDQNCSNSNAGSTPSNDNSTPSNDNSLNSPPYPSPYTPNNPSPDTPTTPSFFNPSYPSSLCYNNPWCWTGGRKLASSYDCDFTVIGGGGLNWCTSVLLIITFIMSLIFGCNEVSESDNIEASKMVDNKVNQEEEPDIHLGKEEEPDIFVPAV